MNNACSFQIEPLKLFLWILILVYVCFRSIGHMQSMAAFRAVCSNRNELHLEIATVIKVSRCSRSTVRHTVVLKGIWTHLPKNVHCKDAFNLKKNLCYFKLLFH